MKLWIVILSYALGVMGETPRPTVTPCNNNACKNGATCYPNTWRTRGYRCYCQSGYVGSLCETATPCLTGNPCQNGGRCVSASWEDDKYKCNCIGGWMDKNCTQASPCVYGNPCQNGGRCTPDSYNDAKYRCYCYGDYYGPNCTIEDPCEKENPCQNSGRCYPSSYKKVGYNCNCRGNYFGDNCEKESPCLKANPCENGGICITNKYRTEGYDCRCATGYEGKNCTLVDPCSSRNAVCKNGGTCSSYAYVSTLYENFVYSCQCPTTHLGKHCEIDSPCANNPCKNGGSCYGYGPGNFHCGCIDGFRGLTCERKPCPVRMNCYRNYTRTTDDLSPTECLAQEKRTNAALKSCRDRDSEAMMHSDSCDCTMEDYFSARLSFDRGIYDNEYTRCAGPSLESLNCDNYTRSCALKIKDSESTLRLDRTSCSDDQINLKSELQKCMDNYEAGKMNFNGCEILEDAYKGIKNTVTMYLKVACTGCSMRSIGQQCMSQRLPFCKQVEEFPKLKACAQEMLEANSTCADAKDSVMTFIESKEMYANPRYKKACGDMEKYWEKLLKAGCVTEADASTITKRDTEEPDLEALNIYDMFF